MAPVPSPIMSMQPLYVTPAAHEQSSVTAPATTPVRARVRAELRVKLDTKFSNSQSHTFVIISLLTATPRRSHRKSLRAHHKPPRGHQAAQSDPSLVRVDTAQALPRQPPAQETTTNPASIRLSEGANTVGEHSVLSQPSNAMPS